MAAKRFVAFGNPLSDTTVQIEDAHLLEKYGLEEDGQSEMDGDAMEALLKDLKQRFQDRPDLLAGRCVCFVRGSRRTAVAHIGAAGRFSLDYLTGSSELQAMLDEATMVHVEGFFLSDRFPVCRYAVEDVQKVRGKPLSYGLGAVYVVQTFESESRFMAERADVVFGTRKEFEALGAAYGSNTGEECLLKLHEMWRERETSSTEAADYRLGTGGDRMGAYGKILAMTDGRHPAVVVWGRGKAQKSEFAVAQLPPERIVDTTGAGDAFLAGFAWGLMNGEGVEVCAKFGIRLAATVVGYVGAEPPPGTRFPSLEDVV